MVSEKEIRTAIDNDDADFFEQRKNNRSDWAFYKYHSIGTYTCLYDANRSGSVKVVRKLLEISTFYPNQLNDDNYIGVAVDEWQRAILSDNNNNTDLHTRLEILKLFIQYGVNPYSFLSKIVKANDRELLSLAFNSSYEIDLDVIVNLLLIDNNHPILMDALIKKFGSLNNVYSNHSTLFMTALDKNRSFAKKLIDEFNVDVNFCGFHSESPLKIVESKIDKTQKNIFQLEEQLESAKKISDDVAKMLKTKSKNSIAQELEREQIRLQTLEILKDSLLKRNAKSFDNKFSNIPDNLKPYVNPHNFQNPTYSFKNFAEEVSENLKKSGLREDTNLFQEILDDLSEYGEKFSPQNSNQNKNSETSAEISLEEHDSFNNVEEISSKIRAPRGWFSIFTCCCKPSSGYQKIELDDENDDDSDNELVEKIWRIG